MAARARLAWHLRMSSSQLRGANFNGLAPGIRKLALTFDDGPNEPYTPQLLEVLDTHGAHATFFFIGRFVAERPNIARSVVAAGHSIGNHSYSHRDLTRLSEPELLSDIEATNRVIEDVTGVSPTLFRPPFGKRNRRMFSVVKKYGMTPVLWRAACYDWRTTSHEKIVNTLLSQIRGGEVILLHDGSHRRIGVDRAQCVRATEKILRHYRSAGYEFLTVPEMMRSAVAQEDSESSLICAAPES
jgi:peptidoglycan/xylan/chitin deacetylase (PgdA/CDA1 family)